jgi:copper chaperone
MSDTCNYRVEGMSCGHCRSSVLEEVGEVAGVEQADVELERGLLSVRGDGFSDEQIAAAVSDAGYQLTGRA